MSTELVGYQVYKCHCAGCSGHTLTLEHKPSIGVYIIKTDENVVWVTDINELRALAAICKFDEED